MSQIFKFKYNAYRDQYGHINCFDGFGFLDEIYSK